MTSRTLFLCTITCLAIAAATGAGLELDPDIVYPGTLTEDGDLVLYGRQRRGGQPAAVAAASGNIDQPAQHHGAAPSDMKWTLGLGVLSNMQQFFDSLRTNLESLETLPQEEKEALLGQTPVSSNIPAQRGPRTLPLRGAIERPTYSHPSRRKTQYITCTMDGRCNLQQDRTLRPKATAAYLHALRNHRPTQKMRNFVSRADPAAFRTSSQYDPNWLWSGSGRKR